jgi:hypothetical protein
VLFSEISTHFYIWSFGKENAFEGVVPLPLNVNERGATVLSSRARHQVTSRGPLRELRTIPVGRTPTREKPERKLAFV